MISIVYSEEFLKHDVGSWHPEKPARLSAIVEALTTVSWSPQLRWQLPTPLDKRDVLPFVRAVHTEDHIQLIRRLSAQGGGNIDGDTRVSEDSYRVALLAVSAWLDGVDWVLKNPEPAFILARHSHPFLYMPTPCFPDVLLKRFVRFLLFSSCVTILRF